MKKKKKSYHRKRQKYQYHGEVTISPLAWIVGLICLPFLLFLLIMSIRDGESGLIVLCSLFLLMPVWMILSINWKITYDAVGFTYRNFFRISRYYKYSEITKVFEDTNSCIYIGRKKIAIDSMTNGRFQFMQWVKRHARKAQYLTTRDRKLFNGNIRGAEEIVFVYFLILAFLCAPMTLMLVSHEMSEDILIGGGIILFCWILTGIISNYILSHADKHPVLVRMIVKEDAIIKK